MPRTSKIFSSKADAISRAPASRLKKTEAEIDAKAVEHETAFTVADLELDHARRFQKTDEGIYARHEILEDEIDEALAGDRKRIAAALRDTQELARTNRARPTGDRRRARRT